MQVPKPSEQDKARFRALVPADDRVEIRPLFGNLGAFVNGNMFMGLLGADIGVKLEGTMADTLRNVEGARPFGPPDRPMGGWLTLPEGIVGTPEGAGWIAAALEQMATLPAKARTR